MILLLKMKMVYKTSALTTELMRHLVTFDFLAFVFVWANFLNYVYEEDKSEKVENIYVNRNMIIGKYAGNGFEVHKVI